MAYELGQLRGRQHWSNCAAPTKFFGINGIAALPWLICILRVSWFMLALATILSAVLIYIEKRKRMTLPALWRSFVVLLGGKRKIPINHTKVLKRFLY